MPDRDLAELYGVATRTLNQAVARNINRFPSDQDQLAQSRTVATHVVRANGHHGRSLGAFPRSSPAPLPPSS
jgi:hypothetical protein